MLQDDLLFASVREQGALLRARKIGPVELTEAYLQRLETLGPRLAARGHGHARAGPRPGASRAAGRSWRGRYHGPLHGIPYGAKDLLATRGVPTTWGAAPLRQQVFDYDATVVEKLRDAGAVLLGKLAMVELAGGLGYNNPDASFTGPGPHALEHRLLERRLLLGLRQRHRRRPRRLSPWARRPRARS